MTEAILQSLQATLNEQAWIPDENVQELIDEVRRLRAALKRYAEHIPGCPHRFDEIERLERGWVRGVPCHCGLDAALTDEKSAGE